MPHIFNSVHHSVVSNSLRPHGLQCARPPCPSSTCRVYSNMSVESVMPSNHLILCHSLFLPPSVFPSVRVFPNAPHILDRKKRKEKYSCWKTSRLITRQKRIEKSQEWWLLNSCIEVARVDMFFWLWKTKEGKQNFRIYCFN